MQRGEIEYNPGKLPFTPENFYKVFEDQCYDLGGQSSHEHSQEIEYYE